VYAIDFTVVPEADMDAQNVRAAIEKSGFIAVLRGNYTGYFSDIARALVDADAAAMEITLNSPNALPAISEVLLACDSKMVIGAGTVLNPDDARKALDAGAQFIVTPNMNPEVIEFCVSRNICVLPGAFTATEVMMAVDLGATMITLFPAELSYFRSLRAPLNQVPFVPTGGVDLENVRDFIAAGAVAVGMGSAIIGEYVKSPGGLQEMTARAEKLADTIQSARAH
jgi:2-dehydro-3-deoxyphosphogluconate aldolase / (4S)-4-hydroxy-2-oxoglutarate aldolase